MLRENGIFNLKKMEKYLLQFIIIVCIGKQNYLCFASEIMKLWVELHGMCLVQPELLSHVTRPNLLGVDWCVEERKLSDFGLAGSV